MFLRGGCMFFMKSCVFAWASLKAVSDTASFTFKRPSSSIRVYYFNSSIFFLRICSFSLLLKISRSNFLIAPLSYGSLLARALYFSRLRLMCSIIWLHFSAVAASSPAILLSYVSTSSSTFPPTPSSKSLISSPKTNLTGLMSCLFFLWLMNLQNAQTGTNCVGH